MSSILHKIADSVRSRLEERKARVSPLELARRCERARTPHPFRDVFGGLGTHVIAEIKFTSPALGALSAGSDQAALEMAGTYLKNGAAAISILTEQDHFHGRIEYLESVRAAYPRAVLLQKDFVVDPYQLAEARVAGADAALLIVALLGEAKTRELLAECRRLGLGALVEVHDEDEFGIASRVGADLIGVNNRNLKTLEISLETSFRLAALKPPGARLISESGLGAGKELRRLREAGYSGFLIGTSLMKTGEPGQALGRLIAEAQEAEEAEGQ